jgi:hypothetical protein
VPYPKKSNAKPRASTTGTQILARLPSDASVAVERIIEDKFRDWAFDLTTRERWGRAWRNLNTGRLRRDLKWREGQLQRIVWEFAGDYASLLEKAVVEYVRELGTVIQRLKIALSEADREEVVAGSFRCAQRFTMGGYGRPAFDRPWDGCFMLPLGSREMPDERTQNVDFQRGNALAWLFQEAQHVCGQDTVTRIFLREIDTGKWKDRARRRAKNELLLATAGTQGDQPPKATRVAKLSGRDKRILELIQRGARGLQYCRELKGANLRPPRPWIEDGCPSEYPAAYLEGQPWRHRIQDEKCKVLRKVKLAGLTELASE